jgi:hypothetical protein
VAPKNSEVAPIFVEIGMAVNAKVIVSTQAAATE